MPPDSAALLSWPKGGLPSAPAGGAGTVLLVDDEPMLRTLISEAMADKGFRVIEAGCGEEGVGLLAASGNVSLLIADLTLAGSMDGCQLAEAARAVQPGLPILFITGSPERGDQALQAGPAGTRVLLKPFRLEALAAAAAAMLSPP